MKVLNRKQVTKLAQSVHGADTFLNVGGVDPTLTRAEAEELIDQFKTGLAGYRRIVNLLKKVQ